MPSIYYDKKYYLDRKRDHYRWEHHHDVKVLYSKALRGIIG
jgi:hypothetical protein